MMRRLLLQPPMTMEEATPWATAAELAVVATFGSERRRVEYLTWRAMVRKALGAETAIAYNEVGAPVLTDLPYHVSVSHCVGRVAVCISDLPCAIDVEPADRDFLRVCDHYMNAEERSLSDDPCWPGYVWCAKEVLYKLSGMEGLDLIRDLSVLSADLPSKRIVGRIRAERPVMLEIFAETGYLVVYSL